MQPADGRILVTGGAGFIGSHVVADLLDRGAAVHVLDDLSAGRRDLVPDGATLHEADLRDADLDALFASVDPDAVVHLAAIHFIPYCNAHPEETFDVNVMGTRRLLETSRGYDLDAVVYASSAAVYPPRNGPHAEDDPVGPMDVYGRTKLVGEDLMRLYQGDTGVPTVSARLFNVYGPNETNAHLIPDVLEQLRPDTGTVELGNLTPARDFVHVTDVARALRLLLGRDEGYAVCNVGTGTEHTVLDVAETAVAASPYDVPIDQSEERMRESDRPHLRADAGHIRDLVGWEPTVSFEEGIGELVDTTVERRTNE